MLESWSASWASTMTTRPVPFLPSLPSLCEQGHLKCCSFLSIGWTGQHLSFPCSRSYPPDASSHPNIATPLCAALGLSNVYYTGTVGHQVIPAGAASATCKYYYIECNKTYKHPHSLSFTPVNCSTALLAPVAGPLTQQYDTR